MQPQIVGKQSGNGEGNRSCTITGRSMGCNLVLRNCQLLPNGRLRSHFPLKRTCFYTWVTHFKQSVFPFSWWLCESASKIPKQKGKNRKKKKKKEVDFSGLNPANVTRAKFTVPLYSFIWPLWVYPAPVWLKEQPRDLTCKSRHCFTLKSFPVKPFFLSTKQLCCESNPAATNNCPYGEILQNRKGLKPVGVYRN